MRERVADFERRTGQRYDPLPSLRGVGIALGDDEACPTLFRFPGCFGLRDFLQGAVESLGPRERRWTWYAALPSAIDASGVRHFGCVAVLEPLRLAPCRTADPEVFVALSGTPTPLPAVWIPADASDALPWDVLATPQDVVSAIGPAYQAQRQAACASLSAYLEEITGLEAAGVAAPDRPWCDLSAAERGQVLEQYGVAPLWSESAA